MQSYDRGLGLTIMMSDLHGETTKAVYDGFGRTTAVHKPSLSVLGAVDPTPVVKITYDLPTDATKRPYALLRTETQGGAGDADDDYEHDDNYTDDNYEHEAGG